MGDCFFSKSFIYLQKMYKHLSDDMKKSFYYEPQFEVMNVNVECGFAQTSNVEDPVEKPGRPW